MSSDPTVGVLGRATLDGSVVGQALLRFCADRSDVWEGTPSDLLSELRLKLSEEEARSRRWRANAQSLSRHLALAAPALRLAGIDVLSTTRGRDRLKVRWIVVTPPGTQGTQGTQDETTS